jgi:hypothetical protein
LPKQIIMETLNRPRKSSTTAQAKWPTNSL